MAILIRCPKCRKSYATKHNGVCLYCGFKVREKTYYLRIGKYSEKAGHSLSEARELEARRKLELKSGNVGRAMTFGEYMGNYFVPHYRAKNKCFPKCVFDYFVSRLGEMRMDKITPAEIEMAVIERTKGLADGTYNKYLNIVRGAFNYAVALELLVKSPVKCRQRREDNSYIRYLEREEAQRLIDACTRLKQRYVWEMVYIALYTGLRYGEIRSLRCEDVRDGHLYVRSEVSKTKKGRVIPLTAELRGFFERACFDYAHDVKKAFRGVLSKVGIKDFRFHDLRHTFASWLVMGGVELYAVKELLGHSSVLMTQRYAHLSKAYLAGAMNRLFD